MEHFPEDVKQEILQYIPSYPRINKKLFNKDWFNRQYCDLPITPQEVLSLQTDFILFVEKRDGFKVYQCEKTEDGYDVEFLNLSYVYYNMGDPRRHFHNDADYEIVSIQETLDRDEYTEIDHLMTNSYHTIYFDDHTINMVLQKRGCDPRTNANFEPLKKYLELKDFYNEYNVDTVYDLMDYLKTYLYLTHDIHIDIPTIHFNAEDSLVIGDDIDKLTDFVDEYRVTDPPGEIYKFDDYLL